MGKLRPRGWKLLALGTALLTMLSAPTMAQEVRYSWLDLSYMAQDFDRSGSQVSAPGQTVDVRGTDGDGVRFRGSIGTWKNLYMFISYASTDVDDFGTVTVDIPPNPPTVSLAEDEFDMTSVRSGVGMRFPIGFTMDAYAELSYDSMDLDFGSFAVENFDANDQDIGASVGVRKMFNDDIELRAYARYSSLVDIDLNTGQFDSGTVIGAGLSWEIIRGISIVGDYETGQFAHWTIGFRLDLDED